MITSNTPSPGAIFEKPFMWLSFAIALLYVPFIAWAVQSGHEWENIHPAMNGMFNGTAAVFLVAGFIAIKRRALGFHRQCMLAAFACSSIFLASYITRFLISGVHKYPGEGFLKTLYLTILTTHTLLAIVCLPLVLSSLFFGLSSQLQKHRKVARYTLPIWLYVSVTGVVVYLMLYPLAPT